MRDVPSNTVHSRYWESKEAANLFGFQYGDDVYEGLEQRIQLLSDSVNQFHGYRSIVEGEGEGLSEYQIFNIRNKPSYLHCAYDIALKQLGKVTMNWTVGCCKEAVLKVNEMGIQATTSARTVQNWNVNFRKKCKFPHPNPKIANGMKYKPSLFEFFPSIELDCKDFIFWEH